MITGYNEIVTLRVLATAWNCAARQDTSIFTANRGYVRGWRPDTRDDQVKVLEPAGASRRTPTGVFRFRTDVYALCRSSGDKRSRAFRLPEKWTSGVRPLPRLAGRRRVHLRRRDQPPSMAARKSKTDILPKHRDLAAWMNGDDESKPSVQTNGTVQLRQSRRVIARFFEALGVSREEVCGQGRSRGRSSRPRRRSLRASFRGCSTPTAVSYDGDQEPLRRVSDRRHGELLHRRSAAARDVRHLQPYLRRRAGGGGSLYVRAQGRFDSGIRRPSPMFDLRIANRSIARFADQIGFAHPAKLEKLFDARQRTHVLRRQTTTVRLSRTQRRWHRAHVQPE